MLKPALARGELRCIGATTLDEYRKHIEKDKALERRFQPVFVGEPSVAGHDRDPARPQGEVRGPPRHPHPRRRAGRRGAAVAPLHPGSLPARQGDRSRSTRPRRASRWRSTRCRRRSTTCSARSCRSRSSGRRWPRRTTSSRKARLAEVEREIAELSEQVDAMKAQWQREKELIAEPRAKPRRRSSRPRPRPSWRSGAATSTAPPSCGTASLPDAREAARRGQRPREARGGAARTGGIASCARRSPRRTSPPSSPSGPASPSRRCSRARCRAPQRDGGRGCTSAWSARSRRSRRSPTPCAARAPGCRIRTGRSARSSSSGPTGVGKTELARALAEFLFDDETHMVRHRHVRVHGEAHGVAPGRRASGLRRLRRGRPAHRGGAPPPLLGRPARRDREGAPRRLQHRCLQVLDDGRLTDGQGRTVDFKNTVVIMTSNVGSQFIRDVDDVNRARCEGADR